MVVSGMMGVPASGEILATNLTLLRLAQPTLVMLPSQKVVVWLMTGVEIELPAPLTNGMVALLSAKMARLSWVVRVRTRARPLKQTESTLPTVGALGG